MPGMKWPFTRTTREPGWLAVSLQPGELSYVHGRYAPGGAATIDLCGTLTFEGEFDAAQHAVREHDFGRYQCSTLLAPGEYQVLLVEAPNVPQAELKTAIRWRIKDLLDYHVNDATLDVLAVPPNPSSSERPQSMYAVAARNDLIQSCIGRFESAQIPLTVIDIPEMSQRNIAALFESSDRGLAMLYMGVNEGLLTMNFRRELMLARRIDVGMQEIISASGAAREELFQRVLLELQRTFDHFDRQFAYVPVAKLMLAPDPEETGLLEYLASNLDLPVERVRLSEGVDFGARAELEPRDEWRLFHLIGAALRHESKVL